MLKLTKAAAKQVKRNATSGDTEELALRVAASRAGDGGIEYRMGFDEVGLSDVLIASEGVDVVIAQDHKPLLNGTTLDFVELEPQRFEFIFLNPNDPHFKPPED